MPLNNKTNQTNLVLEDEQHRQAGFESRLVPDLPLPFIPTLIGLRAFDLVSSRVWWEAATNTLVLEDLPTPKLCLLCKVVFIAKRLRQPTRSMPIGRSIFWMSHTWLSIYERLLTTKWPCVMHRTIRKSHNYFITIDFIQ